MDEITVSTGSFGTDPSFRGTIGSLSIRCGAQDYTYGWNFDLPLLEPSRTELKGVWYFDEDVDPKTNLGNPYNLEPLFVNHSMFPPTWDPVRNRWRFNDGAKAELKFKNFIDFKPDDLIRVFSIVINFEMITPLVGSIAQSND